MTPPRPPRGEVSNRGRASRKAAEKAWGKELGIAARRGALHVRDRLLELRAEHSQVIDGIEYVEWSAVAAALDEEVSRLEPPETPSPRPRPSSGAAGSGPTATAE